MLSMPHICFKDLINIICPILDMFHICFLYDFYLLFMYHLNLFSVDMRKVIYPGNNYMLSQHCEHVGFWCRQLCVQCCDNVNVWTPVDVVKILYHNVVETCSAHCSNLQMKLWAHHITTFSQHCQHFMILTVTTRWQVLTFKFKF